MFKTSEHLEKSRRARKHKPVWQHRSHVQQRDRARRWEKRLPFFIPLILRARSRPGARGWTFLPGLGSAVILARRRGAGERVDETLLFPVDYRGCWMAAGFVATHLLGTTARTTLRLHLWARHWARHWARLWFTVSWTRPGFARAWAGLWFVGPRTGPAVVGSEFTFSWLGARLSSRSGAGLATPLVARGTRPGGDKNANALHDCYLAIFIKFQHKTQYITSIS